MTLPFFRGYRYLDRCTAALARCDLQFALAHHFEPLPDIIQSNMRLIVVYRSESETVVLYDDLDRCFRQPCDDGNMQRIAA